MRIGGFQKISLIDYPGKVSAVVFTQGCNFRCSFCHNLRLVIPSCFDEPLDSEGILDFLKNRVDKLQGVVITGGEPTMQKDLADYLRKIKAMGYGVKLDTNGSRPEVIRQLIEQSLIDYIAMDIKAPLGRYNEVTGVYVNAENIERSIEIILESGLQHRFRTTFPKPLLGEDDLPGILSLLKSAEHFELQPFVPQSDVLNGDLLDKAHYSEEEFNRLKAEWESSAQHHLV